ncbi:ABC transporter substrate-binding protein [Mycobacterium sp. RTGN5]|uniref:ABC transporter substrate-binding protein n=1 Tax=Mycobacterium sp. RTGN5 TaxID=3016522 RepID=UPI0029C69C1B|nr:ABC transporter substrate-binding protein [Mycobacterium sp. RTGN5]
MLVVATALTVAGCSTSGKPGGKSESAGPETQSAKSSARIKDKGITAKGGTVYVLKEEDFESLDPANNYETANTEVGRLIYRSLTFINDIPGATPSIQPDLAESLGTSSDGGSTWTYRLRAGLKYEDGRPITAQDIKYGVMRSFDSDVFPLGATWMKDLLKNETDFKSPYATPEKDLSSVETPDDRTLIFHFDGPQPDADWIMSLPYTAPVPKDADTKEAYSNHPVSSGPYKIENYQQGTALSLVRNENWDPATDPNRPAYPDRFQFDLKAARASERLIKGDGNDAFAVPLDGVLAVSDFGKAQEPAVSPRFINGPGPCVDYIAMNTQRLKDPDIRHAIALAIDRQGIQSAYGGDLYGSVVDSVIPSDIPGYAAPNLGLKPGGDPDAAKKLLDGKSLPSLHIAVADSPSPAYGKEITQIEANLKAVGFEVAVDRHSDTDLTALLDGVDGWDIDPSPGWCADWPTAASATLPVLGPNSDGTTWGPRNAAKYFDPKFSGQLAELKSSTADPAATAKKFVEIANEIQSTAWPVLPVMQDNDPEVVGANVTNVGISPLLSQVDLNTLAVRK